MKVKMKTFDEQWKLNSMPFIQKAFDGFIPRSDFLKKSTNTNSNKLLSLEEEHPNILEVKTQLASYSDKLEDFDNVFASCDGYEYIRTIMNTIIDTVKKDCTSAKSTFVTFSTDVTGSTGGIKHLHPLMNSDRCNVWTFGIPLYIGKEAPTFEVHMTDALWNTRYYIDYKRIRDANLDYMKLTLPKDGSIFTIKFDGARHPHVVTYTDSVYMWFVFDGVEYKDGRDTRDNLTIGTL